MSMNRVGIALEESIKKWEDIIAGKGVDNGAKNCALCQLFIQQEGNCVRCPARKESSFGGCTDTPYIAWTKHHRILHGISFPYKVKCPECKELAQKELDYLNSLR